MRTINTLKVSLLVLLLAAFGNLKAQENEALLFSGDNQDNVDLNNPLVLNNLTPSSSFTMTIWFNISSLPDDGIFLSKTSDDGSGNVDHEFAFGYADSSDKVFAIVGNTVIQSSSTNFADAKWHHAAVTSDGSNFTLYVDGIQEATGSNGTQQASGAQWVLGGRDTSATGSGIIDPLAGKVDELRIFNVERTQSEIRNNIGHEISTSTSGLVAYYKMNKDAAGFLIDYAGSNDGTVNGAVQLGTSTAPVADACIYSLGDGDITNNTDVWMDVELTTESTDYTYTAMQVDSVPQYINGMTYVADHYWDIWANDPDFDGTFTATLTFHYDNLTGIGDENTLQLFTRDDATHNTWTEVTDTVKYVGADTTDGNGYIQTTIDESNTVDENDFKNNYIIASADADNPLPVEFGEITAEWQDGNVNLKWITFTETNNSHFIVERSTDAKEFEDAGTVQGNGTTAEISEYSFTDNSAETGKQLYYRLKQVDFNGNNDYSEVITLLPPQESNLSVYPSMVRNNITFEIEGEHTLSIYNLQGKLMLQKQLDGYSELNISAFPQGTYLYKVQTGSELLSGKFIKQ